MTRLTLVNRAREKDLACSSDALEVSITNADKLEESKAEINLLESLPEISRLAISASGFVFDPVSGQSYTANDSALAILKALPSDLRQSTHLSEPLPAPLLSILRQQFDAPAALLERDVLEFLGVLRELVR